jgi:ribosome-associated toxin RatA of RatAB toxin-antitoxin module
MHELRRSAIVAQPVDALIALVGDIERYPEFVPGCESAQILERNGEEIVARLGVRRGSLTTSFTTRNRLIGNQSLHMRLVDGPFKHFEGYWHFRPLTGGSSEIELQLSYQFSNPLKRAILQPLFAGIAEQMVRAFVQRAQSSASLPDRHE